MYFFVAVLGLHYCAQAFSPCGEWGLLSSFGAWASPVAEHGLQVVAALRLSSCGFSCCEACGLLPDQGWNPFPLHWHVDS